MQHFVWRFVREKERKTRGIKKVVGQRTAAAARQQGRGPKVASAAARVPIVLSILSKVSSKKRIHS
jgi:hypothetical protein